MSDDAAIQMLRLQVVGAAQQLGSTVADLGDWRHLRALRKTIDAIDSVTLETRKGVALAAMRASGSLSHAAEQAGVLPAVIAEWQRRDVEFKEAFIEARMAAHDDALLNVRGDFGHPEWKARHSAVREYTRIVQQQQAAEDRRARGDLLDAEYLFITRAPQRATPPIQDAEYREVPESAS